VLIAYLLHAVLAVEFQISAETLPPSGVGFLCSLRVLALRHEIELYRALGLPSTRAADIVSAPQNAL
jgi:hypothetical protein